MKVVIACDSYKGCMSSMEVAHAMMQGFQEANAEVECYPYAIADGGEGTVEAFYRTCSGVLKEVDASDAYGKKIKTEYALIEDGKTAVIEAANIIGLNMHEREKRAPMFGSSYGVGTVILDAVAQGCKKIIVGLGGTATNDGGMGLLQALGARYYDANHAYLSPQAVNLEKIVYIDLKRLPSFEGIELIAACDVKNYLLGEKGATYVFGKQKGLFPNQIRKLDQGMENYRNHLRRYTGIDINAFEGGGAAGGIGAVLIGLLKAKMVSGIELLLSYSDLEEKIAQCDYVFTGEGQSDAQTAFGKVPMGILNVAKKYHKPTFCISGALGIGYQLLYKEGFVGIFSVADRAMTFQQALAYAPEKVRDCSYTLMHMISYFDGKQEE